MKNEKEIRENINQKLEVLKEKKALLSLQLVAINNQILVLKDILSDNQMVNEVRIHLPDSPDSGAKESNGGQNNESRISNSAPLIDKR